MVASLKGVVLAAGFGTRLRPLTEVYPKPLVPFVGSTPLELALWQLGRAGIEENAVNSHHRPDLIAAYVKRNVLRQRLTVSHEPEILGTGGVYNPLRGWQGADDLVVINGDVVTSIDLPALIRRHRESGATATMALLPSVIPGESAVFHEGGFVVGIGKTPPSTSAAAGNFACVQILTRAFVDLLPKEGSFDVISKGYMVALSRGMPVAAWVHDGIWHDLRTPDFYWQAVKDVVTRPGALAATGVAACRKLRGLTGEHAGASVAATARLTGTVVVEPGAVVGENAVVEDSLLLPGAEVARDEIVRSVILGPALRVALAKSN